MKKILFPLLIVAVCAGGLFFWLQSDQPQLPQPYVTEFFKLEENAPLNEQVFSGSLSTEAYLDLQKNFLEQLQNNHETETLTRGTIIQVHRKGTGRTPTATDQVKVKYKTFLIDGTLIDERYQDLAVDLPLQVVIPAWKEAMTHVPSGTQLTIYAPSELAYGENSDENIPAHSALIFEVEILPL